MASGGGDRDNLQIAATAYFTMKECVVTAGKRAAINVTNPSSLGGYSFDTTSNVSSESSKDCFWGGLPFPSYADFLDFLY